MTLAERQSPQLSSSALNLRKRHQPRQVPLWTAMAETVPVADRYYSVVELLECDDAWFVRVVENGKETINTFELELFAVAFAEDQRMRLGLRKVDRL